MNVLNRVTLKSLRRNRTRTLVTIFGVILSAAMLSAVTSFIASMQNFLYESTVASEGAWEARIEQIPSNRVAAFSNDAEIKTLGLVRNTGYAVLEGCENEDKPYLFFMDFSKEAYSLLAVNLTEGRMPENPDEVVISRHISYNGGVDIQVGQTLTLDIGRRTRSDGEVLWQRNSYETDETLTKEMSRTVTVVGICERPTFEYYSAPGYTVIGYWDPSTMQSGDVITAYMTVFDPSSIYDTVGRLEEQIGVYNLTSYHSDILRAMGVSSNDTFNGIIYGLGTILIVLIVVGSVALIYNAFAISVSERSRQFGMLAGAGATSRQIYRSVLFEALVVGGLGIPIGIAAGVAGIGITMHCLQGAIGSLMSSAVEASVAFRLKVSVPALLVAAAVAMATVLASAWFPARRAAKNTAIDAVRQSNDIRLRPRQVRGNRAVRRLFGMEAELALKNFRRNRRRYRATILSLVISLVLFISVATFNEALQQSAGVVYEATSADLVVTSATDEAERPKELVEAVRELSAVDQAALYQIYTAMADIPASALAREGFRPSVMERENSDGNYPFNVVLIGMEDRAFSDYAESLGIKAQEYFNPDAPRAIVFDRYREQIWEGSDTYYRSGHSLVHNAGMELSLYFQISEKQKNDRGDLIYVDRTVASLDLTAGYFTDDIPFGLNEYQDYSFTVRLLVPLSVAENLLGGAEKVTGIANVAVASEQYHLAEEQINRLITSMALPYYVNNYAAQLETNRNVLLVINVFSYGFIVLISLISIANVFNTISTNLLLRRREFAMLQSVGMTPAGFRRMLCFECLFYGFKALLWGLPLAMLVALWIHAVVYSGVRMGFGLPWAHIGIGVVSIFLIVFVTMIYAMCKIRKGNIVDQLRNENY